MKNNSILVLLITVLLSVITSLCSALPYEIIDLGTLGADHSEAYGINESGQIVGYSYITGDNYCHAFLYENNQMTRVEFSSGNFSIATAINESGQIAGYSNGRAYLLSNGVSQNLGALKEDDIISYPYGLNNLGQVVGISGTDYSIFDDEWKGSAFLYSEGQMKDLNSLISSNSGWTLDVAKAINDNGQIVGSGKFNSDNMDSLK